MTKKFKDKVKNRVEELKQIKKDKDSGKVFCLPFAGSPKFCKSVPGVVPGMITMVTAGSGVGKTQFTKAFFVRKPLEYAIANNIKIKILYFALEESEAEFIDTMICNYISSKCNLRMDILTLQGYRNDSLSQRHMDTIEQNIAGIEQLLSHVEVIDSVYNPTGIYKYCRDHADKNGTHVYEDREFIKKKIDKDGNRVTQKEMTKVYSHYIPNDPNAFTIVIVDHVSLLVEEKNKVTGQMMNKHQTMAQWSSNYALKQITKHWGWAVVNVIQQEQSGEQEQYSMKGESIMKKTEPSLANFANNKEIQRDAKVIVGVYSPDRYGFEKWGGYDIRKFRDTFRAVKILKNRFGPPNKYHSFLFDGATNNFLELPAPVDDNGLSKFYVAADKLLGRVQSPKKVKINNNTSVNFGGRKP